MSQEVVEVEEVEVEEVEDYQYRVEGVAAVDCQYQE